MASEVRVFKALIPHGTALATPVAIDVSFPSRNVSRVDVRIPPGPRGEVGFRIGTGGIGVIPDNSGAWIITDNETLSFVLTGLHNSGSWQLIGYNTGTYDHTVYLTFFLDPVAADSQPAQAVIPSMVGQEIA